MRKLYLFLLLFLCIKSGYSQDSLKTEIVFKSTGKNPLKVYQLLEEKYLFYGRSSYFDDDHQHSHNHYPYMGTSYKREYLFTAPANIYIPNNKEETFVIVDEKNSLSKAFTINTDGKKQVWNLIPTGKNYKLGKATLAIGVAGLIYAGVLLGIAAKQDFVYKQDLQKYESDLAFQSNSFNKTAPSPIYSGSDITFILEGKVVTIPAGTKMPSPANNYPAPPTDRRIGYVPSAITATLSLTTIITGVRIILKNHPKVERIE